jgi:hypothetical protein
VRIPVNCSLNNLSIAANNKIAGAILTYPQDAVQNIFEASQIFFFFAVDFQRLITRNRLRPDHPNQTNYTEVFVAFTGCCLVRFCCAINTPARSRVGDRQPLVMTVAFTLETFCTQ